MVEPRLILEEPNYLEMLNKHDIRDANGNHLTRLKQKNKRKGKGKEKENYSRRTSTHPSHKRQHMKYSQKMRKLISQVKHIGRQHSRSGRPYLV